MSTGHRILPSFDSKVCETMVAKFKLVLKEPHQFTKFTEQVHLKQNLAENSSLQRSNCNILGLTGTMALLANEARIFRFRVFFGACSFPNEVSDPPFFFTFLAKVDHYLSAWQV